MKRRGWFRFKKQEAEEPSDILSISREIEQIVENTVHRVFTTHRTELMAASPAFVVPAVWGVKKDGRLTDSQVDIHQVVAPAIDSILRLLNLRDLSPTQEFALTYLVRSLFIAKITFMVELARGLANQRLDVKRSEGDPAGCFESIGEA